MRVRKYLLVGILMSSLAIGEGNSPCSVQSFGVEIRSESNTVSLASDYPTESYTHRMIHIPCLLPVRRVEVGVVPRRVNPILGTEHGLGVFLPRTGRHRVSIDQF